MLSAMLRPIPAVFALAALAGCASPEDSAVPGEDLGSDRSNAPLSGLSARLKDQFSSSRQRQSATRSASVSPEMRGTRSSPGWDAESLPAQAHGQRSR